MILFNPRSGKWKHRIPNSILQVGASIENKYKVIYIDGNLEVDPWQKIEETISKHDVAYFGCTVMPGPQLKQAIPLSKKLRTNYPKIKIIWGGYFATNQYKPVLNSGFVDVVVAGPGDTAFPNLLMRQLMK